MTLLWNEILRAPLEVTTFEIQHRNYGVERAVQGSDSARTLTAPAPGRGRPIRSKPKS